MDPQVTHMKKTMLGWLGVMVKICYSLCPVIDDLVENMQF